MTNLESSATILTLRNFLALPFKLFSAVGIKFFSWDDNDKMTTKEKLIFVLIFINSTVNVSAKFSYILFDEFEDILHMSEWSLYASYAANGFLKVFFVFLGRKNLKCAINSLQPLFSRKSKVFRDFSSVQDLTYITRRSKIMIILQFSTALAFNIFPLVHSIIEYLSTKVFITRLPFILSYPFDINYGMRYVLAYISQILASFTVVTYYVAPDIFLNCLIYAVILQFKWLCCRIQHFEPKSYQQDMCELKDIVETHNLLNTLAEDVNNVFCISILLNYLLAIMMMVQIGVQFVFRSDLLDCMKFFGFFLSSSTEIYYICMFGEQLLENSGLVGESFVGQKWYMADVRYQRMLTLAIARSQKPAYLSAYKFFIISKESFSNLMTTAYQGFTLLKTGVEEKNI